MSKQRHKRAVLCEELTAITDDAKEAIILHQLLYWVPRMRDVDAYIEEVRNQLQQGVDRNADVDLPKANGWIYKSANELSEETMIGSDTTVRRRLRRLIEAGFIEERDSPHSEWDNTLQYRVDAAAIEAALQAEGYTLRTVMAADFPTLFARESPEVQPENRSPHSEPSQKRSEQSQKRSEQSQEQSERTIPETTSESTSESTDAARAPAHEGEAFVQMYEEAYPKESLTAYQKDLLRQKIDDRETWADVIDIWRGNSYNPSRLKKMIDRYENELAEEKKGEGMTVDGTFISHEEWKSRSGDHTVNEEGIQLFQGVRRDELPGVKNFSKEMRDDS